MKNWNPFYRWSIRTKIVLMIITTSVIFGAGILFFIRFQIQDTRLKEAINKTLSLADGLSTKAVEPVQVEDINALQFIQGEAISQPEVAYCFIRDGKGKVLSSSFEGNAIPPVLKEINMLQPGERSKTQPAEITLRDSVVPDRNYCGLCFPPLTRLQHVDLFQHGRDRVSFE
jgi:hypothetical protein